MGGKRTLVRGEIAQSRETAGDDGTISLAPAALARPALSKCFIPMTIPIFQTDSKTQTLSNESEYTNAVKNSNITPEAEISNQSLTCSQTSTHLTHSNTTTSLLPSAQTPNRHLTNPLSVQAHSSSSLRNSNLNTTPHSGNSTGSNTTISISRLPL